MQGKPFGTINPIEGCQCIHKNKYIFNKNMLGDCIILNSKHTKTIYVFKYVKKRMKILYNSLSRREQIYYVIYTLLIHVC